jgi:Patatin-like phospholipase
VSPLDLTFTNTTRTHYRILNKRFGQMSREICGIALIVVGGAAWLFGSPVYGHRLYPLGGSFCQSGGLALVCAGALFVIWARFPTTLVAPAPNNVWKAAARGLSWLITGTLIGELIWYLASRSIGDTSYRTYSIWALLHSFASLVVIASLVDFWHTQTTFPARQVAIVVLAMALWTRGPEVIQDVDLSPIQQIVDGTKSSATHLPKPRDWYDNALARLQAIKSGPFVIVVASGGGSRAAIFTMLALDWLARTPMRVESFESPCRPSAGSTAEQSKIERTWADNIFLISSVSGGSVATSTFVTRKPEDRGKQIADLRNTSRDELVFLIAKHLERVQKKASEKDRKKLEDVQKQCNAWEGSPIEWVFKDELVDEMCTDFMAPIFRGMFTPGITRGDALAHFWEQRFNWGAINRSNWADKLNPNQYPLVILNATDIDLGSRLAIGLPPLPLDIFNCGKDAKHPREDNDRLPREFGEYEPCGRQPLGLARAVRLSSNFPWGFPIASFNTHSSPSTGKDLRVLDGGVIDNTGIDAVYHIVDGLTKIAENNQNPTHDRANQVLEKLRQRGVVVIEIDSGAKPLPQQQRSLASIREPLRALDNALYNNAAATKEFYHDRLASLLAARPGVPIPPTLDNVKTQAEMGSIKSPPQPVQSVYWESFECNHLQDANAEVMTAWALGPKDKAVVFGQFVTNLNDWKRDLNEELEKFRCRALDVLNARRTLAKQFLMDEAIAESTDLLEATAKNATGRRIAKTPASVSAARSDAQKLNELLALAERYAKDISSNRLGTIRNLKGRLDSKSQMRNIASGQQINIDELVKDFADVTKSSDFLNFRPSESDTELTTKLLQGIDDNLTLNQDLQERVTRRAADRKRLYENTPAK